MQSLAKGANAPLPPGPVVGARHGERAGRHLGAAADRRPARCAATPTSSSTTSRRRRACATAPDGVDVDPAAVDAGDRVRSSVTASLDGSGPATFGALGRLRLDVAVAGTPVAAFEPDGLGAETALLCVEIYRRAGQWKVRAVGQGYADGLAGIATDFGITVETSRPPRRATRRPPPATTKINLDKGRVSLAKRQTVSLTKTGAPPLRRVAMGLGWDPARQRPQHRPGRLGHRDRPPRQEVGRGLVHEQERLPRRDRALRRQPDRRTAPATTRRSPSTLPALPADVVAIVFVVNSFQGQKFTEVRSAYCRLLDLDTGAELVRFDLTDSEPRTGVVMSVLRRDRRGLGDDRDRRVPRRQDRAGHVQAGRGRGAGARFSG